MSRELTPEEKEAIKERQEALQYLSESDLPVNDLAGEILSLV